MAKVTELYRRGDQWFRADRREVLFKLIPQATSRRFKVFKNNPALLWLRHPLNRQCIKALPHVRIVDIK